MDPLTVLWAVREALVAIGAAASIISKLPARAPSARQGAEESLLAKLVASETESLQRQVVEFSEIDSNPRYSTYDKEQARKLLAARILHTIEISRQLLESSGTKTDLDAIVNFCRSISKS